MFVHFWRQVTTHVCSSKVPYGAKCEAGYESVVAVEIVFESVGGEHEDFGFFGEEEHHAEVADTFFGEVGG